MARLAARARIAQGDDLAVTDRDITQRADLLRRVDDFATTDQNIVHVGLLGYLTICLTTLS